jgi:hypothetical protein
MCFDRGCAFYFVGDGWVEGGSENRSEGSACWM